MNVRYGLIGLLFGNWCSFPHERFLIRGEFLYRHISRMNEAVSKVSVICWGGVASAVFPALAEEAALRETSVWEEPAEEDSARAAGALIWDEYSEW